MSSSVALIDWHAYSGYGQAAVAVILLAIGVAFLVAGRRSQGGFKVPLPGTGLKIVIVLLWVLSILLVLPMFKQVARATGQSSLGLGPVFPITLTCAFVTFVAVAYITRGGGALAALGNGFAAAAAGPMVFELPFVLIIAPVVTTKAPHPLLLFLTFLVVILTTLALPAFSTRFSVTRSSLYLFAAMLVVFAAWAASTGYAPPADPTSLALNAVSKVLGFVAVAAGFNGASSRAVDRAGRVA